LINQVGDIKIVEVFLEYSSIKGVWFLVLMSHHHRIKWNDWFGNKNMMAAPRGPIFSTIHLERWDYGFQSNWIIILMSLDELWPTHINGRYIVFNFWRILRSRYGIMCSISMSILCSNSICIPFWYFIVSSYLQFCSPFIK